MKNRIEEFEKQKNSSPEFEKFSDELNNYLQRKIIKNNPKFARDLEQKLRDGNRERFLQTALECKNRIHRKIVKYGL